jgi:hypothetical protein
VVTKTGRVLITSQVEVAKISFFLGKHRQLLYNTQKNTDDSPHNRQERTNHSPLKKGTQKQEV